MTDFFVKPVGFRSTLKNATLKNDPGVWLVISGLGRSKITCSLSSETASLWILQRPLIKSLGNCQVPQLPEQLPMDLMRAPHKILR